MSGFTIIYAATGERCFNQAVESAKTARQFMPIAGIYLFSDKTSEIPDVFTDVFKITSPDYSCYDKIPAIIGSQLLSHDKFLFLDTDTRVIGNISEIFDLLDRFDLVFVHAPIRKELKDYANIPVCFPQPNTGVIGYKNTDEIKNLMANWEHIYLEQKRNWNNPPHDQLAFRKAVYDSDVKLGVLPEEYNIRTIFPFVKGGNSYAKILHGNVKTNNNAKNKLKGNYKNRVIFSP